MLNEISKAEKDKHHLIYVVCKKEKNQVHRNREWMSGCQMMGGGSGEWGVIANR